MLTSSQLIFLRILNSLLRVVKKTRIHHSSTVLTVSAREETTMDLRMRNLPYLETNMMMTKRTSTKILKSSMRMTMETRIPPERRKSST